MVKTGGFAYDRSRRIGLFADLGRIPVRELDFTVLEVKTGVFGEKRFRIQKSCLEGSFDWQVEPTEKWCLDLKKKRSIF